jgi:hypothetical protein
MPTYRVANRQRYTSISREPINDQRLSFRARGVLVWLLDKPDDWRTDSDAICAAGAEGRDAVRAALSELQLLGYLVRTRRQDSSTGQWTTDIMIHESPTEAEVLVEPTTDSQASEIQASAGQASEIQASESRTSAGQALRLKTETDDCDQQLRQKTEKRHARPAVAALPATHPSDADRLCTLMASLVSARLGHRQVEPGKKWVEEMDYMIRLDHRQPSEIERVIRWLDGSDHPVALFWRPNIESPVKLRAKWDTISGQYARHKERANGVGLNAVQQAAMNDPLYTGRPSPAAPPFPDAVHADYRVTGDR